MATQSTLAVTTRRSMLGQLGLLLLIGVALGVFGMVMLQTYPGGTGTAKSAPPNTAGAIQPAPGQDVLSVEWLEQQRAMRTSAPAVARPQDDVLSVEWLEQYRQSTSQEPHDGGRATQRQMDNYIGFIE